MTGTDPIVELNKRLDQAAELIQQMQAVDFHELPHEERMKHACVLHEVIEQAKIVAELLKR
jgi:hypothetical protein